MTTYLSIIASPVEAFERLAKTQTWGWAAVAGIVLFIAAMLIMMPEQLKLAHIQQAAAYAGMTADQRAQAQANPGLTDSITKAVLVVVGFVGPWIAWFVAAIVFVLGAALSGAGGRFSLAWVASVNASIISFLAGVVNAVIIAIKGPDAISAASDLYALPSPGWFVSGSAKLAAFLTAFNLGNLIYYVVAAIAMERMLGMKRPAAIVTVAVFAIVSGGLAAMFAK